MAKEEDKLINCDPLDVEIDGSPVELSIDFLPPFDPGMVSPDKRDFIVAQLRWVFDFFFNFQKILVFFFNYSYNILVPVHRTPLH